jgi:N-acetyl sugar amidotransferase
MADFESNPFSHLLHKHPYRQCTQCVMDTSDPEITFDSDGVCSHCSDYSAYCATLGATDSRRRALEGLVAFLKAEGSGKDYDCIMGLSGGVDSSFLAYYAVRVLGLRPLIVHVDSGWNSELAVSNIEGICRRLEVHLHTLVIDWEEMRDLQLAFFRSGVANLDVPQDHAFNAALIREAKRYGIRQVLNGGNMQTESILPKAWGYDASDPVHLRSIHKTFGKLPLKSFPVRGDFSRFVTDPFFYRMKVHRPLEYFDYNKFEAKRVLREEMGWRDYGGKHYESRFTKFFQGHYLPAKFGYDKRKAHLSSLIVSGQISREDALRELAESLYAPEDLESDITYFCKKLGISRAEYERVMSEPPRFFSDYPNRRDTYERLRRTAGAIGGLLRRVRKVTGQ